jgi:ribonucleoside-diphosphate reductase alpha subunit
MKLFGINIDLSRDQRLEEYSLKLLKDYYMLPDEASPQEAFARAAVAYCPNDLELAQRIYDYASKGWFMFASPVLSNAPRPGQPWKALPISCFLTYVPDSLEGLIEHTDELRWLSVKGGGVGGHWSDIRAVSDKAPGPIPFLKTVDADMTAYRQGRTRKGSYAAYLDCDHPDILEFIGIRTPTGGDVNRKCFNLHIAINWTDKFMHALAADEDWQLLDPNDGSVRDTIKARELWGRALETRSRTGEPYFFFIDTARKALPQCQKDLGLDLNGSNLCIEIDLATSADRTAVCCLSSLSLEHWDEYCDQLDTVVGDLIRFLDNVLQAFIDHAPPVLAKAVYSATQERSLGLGTMGFHSWLQKNNIAWESLAAVFENRMIFSRIQTAAIQSSEELARERGEFPDAIKELQLWDGPGSYMVLSSSDYHWVKRTNRFLHVRGFDIEVGDELIMAPPQQLELFSTPPVHVVQRIEGKHSHSGRRNAHLIAIAPNANSAVANNMTTPSVEPSKSNAFTQKMRTGSFLVKNPYLDKLLRTRLDTDSELDTVWSHIINNHGSVQDLSILTEDEKAVFKTAFEINQEWVVQHAADRQEYVCQGQSINLFFPSGAPKTYVNKVHLQAWKQGLKSLYYLRTSAGVTADKVSIKHERQALGDYIADTSDECLACHA